MAKLGDLRLELGETTRPNGIVNHSGQNDQTTGWRYEFIGFDPPNDMSFRIQAETDPRFPRLDGDVLAGAYPDRFGNGRTIAYRVAAGALSDPGEEIGASPACPVAPGDWVGFAVSVAVAKYTPATGPYPVINWQIAYYGPDGTELTATPWARFGPISNTGSPWSTVDIVGASSVPAPTNTTSARLRFWFGNSDGTGPTSPDDESAVWHYLTKLYMARGATAADVDNLTFSDGEPQWSDILGEVTRMSVTRGGEVDGLTDKIDVGTMTAEIRSHTLTPAGNDSLRRGRLIRASTYGRSERGDRWAPFYTGRIATADAAYGDTKRDPTARPVVVITAVDAVELAQNTQHAYGYSGTWEESARELIARSEYPGSVDISNPGNGPVEPPADDPGAIIDRQDNASLYDQLNMITTTWPNAHWFVNKYGDLAISDTETYNRYGGPAGPYFADDATPGSFPGPMQSSYTAIDVNFGSAAHVNVVTVRRRNLAERDGDKVYGPYLNQDSLIEWGKSAAELTVNNGTPRDTAERYLATFGVPQVFARSIELSIDRRDPTAWTDIAGELDIYTWANVKHAPSGLDTGYYVIGIEHEITPDQWHMTIRFRPAVAPAEISVVDPPGGPNTGPSDLVEPAPGPLSVRRISSNVEIENAQQVSIPFDDQQLDKGTALAYDEINRRWVAERSGRYIIVAGAEYAENGTGRRYIYVSVNGGQVARRGGEAINGGTEVRTIALIWWLDRGDYLAINVYQDSGAPLDLIGGGTQTTASVAYLDW